MSHIMDRLKNLEKSVSTDSKPSELLPPPGKAPRSGTRSVNRGKLPIILTAIIIFGLVGYLAGIKSQKNRTVRPEGTEDKSNVVESVEYAKPVSSGTSLDEGSPVVIVKSTTEKEDPPGPSEMSFSDTEIISTGVPIAGKDVQVIASVWPNVMEPASIKASLSGESLVDGDGKKATLLAAAIMKSTHRPVSKEEDLKNRKTIRNINILGIIQEGDMMVAIISGQDVKEGEEFRQFSVHKIANDYVIFSFRQRLYRKFMD